MSDSMMDMVFTTVGIILVMLLVSCLCCLFMKLSDLQLKRYIVKTAKRKGLKVELDKLNPRPSAPSPIVNENCTIIVPDVGIVM